MVFPELPGRSQYSPIWFVSDGGLRKEFFETANAPAAVMPDGARVIQGRTGIQQECESEAAPTVSAPSPISQAAGAEEAPISRRRGCRLACPTRSPFLLYGYRVQYSFR